MTKEEYERGLELQGYRKSIEEMTLGNIALKFLKEHHLPKFLKTILVKFAHPLLLLKDVDLDKATELLNEAQGYIENIDDEGDELYDKIEQFLKGENIILEDAQAGNSPFDADKVFNKEMKAYPEEK